MVAFPYGKDHSGASRPAWATVAPDGRDGFGERTMNVSAVGRFVGVRASATLGGGAVALLFLLVTQVGVASATSVTVDLDVAGMTFWGNESHIGTACGSITATQGRELHGTGQGGVGAFMENLILPNRAKLTKLTVVAHDNDASFGTD